MIFHPQRYLQMFDEIRDFRPDIIHINERNLGFFPVLSMFDNRKIVLTIHDPVRHIGSGSWYSGIETSAFMHMAQNIIVHGEKFRKCYPHKRVFVIPHGEYGRFQGTSDDIVEQPDTLLFFGRVTEYKGIDVLVKAMKDVWAVRPKTKLDHRRKGLAESARDRYHWRGPYRGDEQLHPQRSGLGPLPEGLDNRPDPTSRVRRAGSWPPRWRSANRPWPPGWGASRRPSRTARTAYWSIPVKLKD